MPRVDLFAMVIALCWSGALAQSPTREPLQTTRSTTIPAEALDRASIVVIGTRVITRPADAFVPGSPVQYGIKVEQTLKGYDEAGFTLLASGLELLSPSQRYIVALVQYRIHYPLSPAVPAIVATPDAVDSVGRQLRDAGATVGPKRVVWIQYLPGNEGLRGLLLGELTVLHDGTWRSVTLSRRAGVPATQEASGGRTTQAQLAQLQKVIAEVEDESGISDARSLSFRWIDGSGNIQMRRCVGDDEKLATYLRILQSGAAAPR